MIHVDLFSGIGGFSLALDYILRDRPKEDAGVEETLSEGGFYDGRVDLLTAGFPCQAHSTAAHGNNPAACLWPETFNVIRQLRPVWIVLENVPGYRLLHIERSCDDLESIGYTVWPVDIGVEVRKAVRRRIYVVAHADEDGKPQRAFDAEASGIQEIARRWWGVSEPLGVDDGLSIGLDRMRALGDSVRVYDAALVIQTIFEAAEQWQ